MRRRGTTKQRLWLGPGGYPGGGWRRFANADTYGYTNADSTNNSNADSDCNTHTTSKPDTDSQGDAESSSDPASAPDSVTERLVAIDLRI